MGLLSLQPCGASAPRVLCRGSRPHASGGAAASSCFRTPSQSAAAAPHLRAGSFRPPSGSGCVSPRRVSLETRLRAPTPLRVGVKREDRQCSAREDRATRRAPSSPCFNRSTSPAGQGPATRSSPSGPLPPLRSSHPRYLTPLQGTFQTPSFYVSPLQGTFQTPSFYLIPLQGTFQTRGPGNQSSPPAPARGKERAGCGVWRGAAKPGPLTPWLPSRLAWASLTSHVC